MEALSVAILALATLSAAASFVIVMTKALITVRVVATVTHFHGPSLTERWVANLMAASTSCGDGGKISVDHKDMQKKETKHNRYPGTTATKEEGDKELLVADGSAIQIFHEKDPASIHWGESGAHYVCEPTGIFTEQAKAELHIKGGAKKVIISAPLQALCRGT